MADPVLRSYDPTWRDRLAAGLLGDSRPSPERRRLVEGLLGSSGTGSTGGGLIDFTPAGIPLAAQEAKRDAKDGDWKGATLNAMSVIPALKPEAAAAKAALRSLPHDNYRAPLSMYEKSLYREVSPEHAANFLPNSHNYDAWGGREYYVASHPELALGQGNNKGVRMELDPAHFNGQINTRKPGWEALWQGGQAEYLARPNQGVKLPDTVRSMTISPDADMSSLWGQRLTKYLDQSGWTREEIENGMKYSRPTE